MLPIRVDEIADNVFHTHSRINSTWGGNIVDMIRFKKYLEIIKEENLVENAATVGDYLLNKLVTCSRNTGKCSPMQGAKDLYCAIDLPNGELRRKAIGKIFDKGVIVLGSGEKSIRFRPSLNIKKEHVDEAIEVIDKVVKEL